MNTGICYTSRCLHTVSAFPLSSATTYRDSVTEKSIIFDNHVGLGGP